MTILIPLRTMTDMQNPPIIPRPGKPPISFWDQEWHHTTGHWPAEGWHYLPGEGLVSAEDLYQRDRAKRGRPLRYTLTQARAIKRAYWSGEATIVQLAEQWRASEVTVSRIVHGQTYWYA